MAEVSRIRLYPIKSLDGVEVENVSIRGSGRLNYDREYALFDEDGYYINGRQNPLVHKIKTTFDLEEGEVTFETPDADKPFKSELENLTEDTDLHDWLTEFFDEPVTIKRAKKSNFNDSAGGIVPTRISATGPTVVSTATLDEVASWYTDLTTDDIRRRLRTNIEIDDVEPFWEDKLFSDADVTFGSPGNAVAFTIGDVTHHGIMSKPRCVVPSRDPDTGELKKDFVSRFTEMRAERFPDWADADSLGEHIEFPDGTTAGDNYYYLTVVTRIPGTEQGKQISVGDEVTIQGEVPLLETH